MSVLKFYVLALILFLLERISPLFFDIPLILIPILVIYYFFISQKKIKSFGIILPVIAVGDLFSGLSLGVFAISLSVVLLLIFLLDKIISLNKKKAVNQVAATVFFTSIFVFILALFVLSIGDFSKNNIFFIIKLLLNNFHYVFLQTVLVALLLYLFDKKYYKYHINLNIL